MTMYVVDTNVISFLIKLRNGHLRKDADRIQKYADLLEGQELVKAFPTEAELHVWVKLLAPGEKRDQYEKGIQEILDQTASIEGDERVAKHWATVISKGKQLGMIHVHDPNNPKREAQLNDTWIAACALAHGLALVSDNRRDFEWMGDAVGLNLVTFA